MGFHSWSLLVNYSFSLFDLIHIVLHLVIEIIFEEFQEIVLNVYFFDLTIDRLQLIVNLWRFHLAKAFQFATHFMNFAFFLIQTILFALLFNFWQNLRFNQVQFKIDFQKAPVLFDEKREDISTFLSECISSIIKWLETWDEFHSFAQQVSSLVTELILTEIDLLEPQFVVLKACSDKFFDSIHLYAVATQVQVL